MIDQESKDQILPKPRFWNRMACLCPGVGRRERELKVARQDLEKQTRLQQSLENELEQTREKLAESEASRKKVDNLHTAKTKFLSTLGHEIRSPLNGILGYIRLLQETEPNSEQREYLDSLRTCGENLSILANNILDLAKFEAGTLEVESQPVDLDALLENILDVHAHLAREKRVEISFALEERVPDIVLTDSVRLRQVLLNLVGNSVKFTSRGSVRIRVKSENQAGENAIKLEFRVSDTGKGIPDELRPKLFQPWQQGKDQRVLSGDGAGLGLSICRELCQLMGGDIRLESTSDKGATFVFEILAQQSGTQEHTVHHRSSVGCLHLITPSDSIRMRLQRLLQPKNWSMHFCAPSEALHPVCAKETPTAVVVDLCGTVPLIPPEIMELARSCDAAGQPFVLLLPPWWILSEISCPGNWFALRKPLRAARLNQCLRKIIVMHRHPQWIQLSTDGLDTRDETVFAGERILVVEADHNHREFVVATLENAGFEVEHTDDPGAALVLQKEAPCRILLMDPKLPSMDGLVLLRKMHFLQQTQKDRSNLLCLVMTDGNNREQRLACLTAGINGFLAKPFSAQTLLQEVQGLLARQSRAA